MNNFANELIQNYFLDYKKEFIYLDLDTLLYSDKKLSGKFSLNKCPYLTIDSLVLNNTESLFIANQAQFVTTINFLIENNHISSEDMKGAIKKLDCIALKKAWMKFNKLIIKSKSNLNFECSLNNIFIDHKDRMCFTVKTDICDGAHVLEGDGIFLHEDFHHDGLK